MRLRLRLKKELAYLLILIVICGLVSCKKGKEVAFDTGFSCGIQQRGIFFDNESNQECVYFYETQFKNQLKFFNLNGNILDSISLSEAKQILFPLSCIVVSRDSIIFTGTDYSSTDGAQKTIILNRKGEIIKSYNNISNLLTDSINYNGIYSIHYSYQYSSSYYKKSIREIIFSPAMLLIDDSLYQQLELEQNNQSSSCETERLFAEKRSKAYLLAKINKMFTDSISIELGYNEHYSHYKTLTNEAIFSRPYRDNQCRYLNGRLFFFDTYNNYIQEIDQEKMTVLQKIKVVSDDENLPEIQTINCEHDTKNTYEKYEEEYTEKSYIVNMIYKESQDEYLVFFKTGKMKYPTGPYSFRIIVFDKNFNKKRELNFDQDKYIAITSLITDKEEILVETKKDNFDGKIYYTYIRL